MNSPEKKSHDEHHAEAADKHGIQAKKPEEEVGEPHEPKPTSHTDTGDAESKGKTAGSKPEGEQGGSEDSKEGAQPQDKDHKGDESPEKAKNTESRQNKGDGDSPADGSDKKGDKKSADEQKDGGDSGKGTKGQGQMNDSQESVRFVPPNAGRLDANVSPFAARKAIERQAGLEAGRSY